MKRNFKYKDYLIKIFISKHISFYCGNVYYKIEYDIYKNKDFIIDYNDNTNYMGYSFNELLEIAKNKAFNRIDRGYLTFD